MAAILNTVILNSALLDSAILHKTLTQTNSIWLKLIHSHSTWRCQPFWILPLGFSHFEQKKFTHSFSLNLRMAAILNSTILDSAILHKKKLHSFILTLIYGHSHLEFYHVGLGFIHFAILDSDTITYSFWLNLMMAAILKSAMLDSATAILDSDTLVIFSEIHSETL